jgi:hypothetical protein
VISEQRPRNVIDAECIRCREADAVDEAGYCGPCYWFVRAEIEHGIVAMREYLLAWAQFAEWCRARGQTTH